MRKTPYFLLPLLLAGIGCGGKGVVSGNVTHQGKPVSNGWVLMVGSDTVPHHGKIAQDGSYTVRDVPTGEAKVAVIIQEPQEKATAKSRPPAKAETNQQKYSNPLESGLTCKVRRGENSFDIKLD